jgi:hypothetical protein
MHCKLRIHAGPSPPSLRRSPCSLTISIVVAHWLKRRSSVPEELNGTEARDDTHGSSGAAKRAIEPLPLRRRPVRSLEMPGHTSLPGHDRKRAACPPPPHHALGPMTSRCPSARTSVKLRTTACVAGPLWSNSPSWSSASTTTRRRRSTTWNRCDPAFSQ